MSFLLALSLVGEMAVQDPASLLARIEALEARNRDLEAQLERLATQREPSMTAPVPAVVAAAPSPRPSLAPPIPTSEGTWDHSYAGVQIGERRVVNQEAYSDLSNFYTYIARRNEAGFVSLQFGRRWQSGSLVFGGEVSASAPIGSNPSELYVVNPPFNSADALNHYRRTASAAVSGEVGWAINGTLLYSRIGVESAQLRTTRTSSDKTTSTENVTAPFVGLGLGQKLDRDWSLELEGRYGYARQGLAQNDFALGLRINYLVP